MACYGHVEMSASKWWKLKKKTLAIFTFQPCPISSKQDFFSFIHSFYISFSLSAYMYVNIYVCVCMYACMYVSMYIFKILTAFFSAHCTVVPLTYSTSQKGRCTVNAKLAPDHAGESAKAYIRMASSNNSNSSFSCSLFIGLNRRKSQTLFSILRFPEFITCYICHISVGLHGYCYSIIHFYFYF